MNKDLMYYFDKTSPYQRHELGEIQSGFNMSFVIDGTKDSAKVLVYSFSETEIEPNTILWHEKTDTWWIVSRDKVERHLNDNNDFVYFHNLQLLGAIELLNARDLTDCGFNQGRYTNAQFIMRLFKLSNFEFQVVFANPSSFNQQVVSYVKTFENYTLLSALREFLDGYNMCAKLSFQTSYSGGNTYLYYAKLMLISKTGDNSLISHNISEFDDVRETKTFDRNSFGTTVVSNAENVISGIEKTYPSTGCVRASGTEYRILAQNGVIRLPSKVYKGNWLKIATTKAPLFLTVKWDNFAVVNETFIGCNAYDKNSIDKAFSTIMSKVDNGIPNIPQDVHNAIYNALYGEKDRIATELKLASTITLYNGNELNPITGEIVQGAGVSFLTKVNFWAKENIHPDPPEYKPLIFCDEETKKTLPIQYQGIQWKRGSNEITGFDAFVPITGTSGSIQVNLTNTDLHADLGQGIINEYEYFHFNYGRAEIWLATTNLRKYKIHFGTESTDAYEGITQFIINYIPMTDLKVKVDNQQEKRDTHLYNQNGKLTDNIALSKLLNSYSKEISSNKITRYKAYRNYALVPKVGSFVTTTNGDYVVNNVSLDFSQNEYSNNDFCYFIECEITTSKYCAAKSLNVNPNTNIRDYGIPQNFNVKRKQLYRDYYELGYASDPNADQESYLAPSKVFDLDERPNEDSNFVCVIKCSYNEQIEGQYNWYYQLETTVYNMEKMLYVVCDFNDNNIIGYASQNVYSGFDISRVISGNYDDLNTPISYVDSKGEVKDIAIKFCNNEQLTNAYDEYLQQQSGGSTYQGSLYNYSCFIPQEIYENMGANEYTFIIEEQSYNKDAIEVPVFEYACQIEDSEDVLIGDNIFPSQKGNVIYMYSFVIGTHLNQNNVIADNHISYNANNNTATLINAAQISLIDENTLRVRLFEERYYYTDDMNFGYSGTLSFSQEDEDYAIFRHTFDLETNQETNVELVMIAKNVAPSSLSQFLDIVINHYRLS